MGQRPGFLVKRQGPAFPDSGRTNEITVEIRIFAPAGTARDRIEGLLADALDSVNTHMQERWTSVYDKP